MDRRLTDAAVARGGVFAHRHAVDVGVIGSQLTRLVAAGEVVKVRSDAYVLGRVWKEASSDEQLILRTRAVLESLGEEYAAASASALALNGLPVWGVDRTLVHAVGPVLRTRTRAGLRRAPVPVGEDLVEACGIPTLPIGAALCDVAAGLGLPPAVVAADAALHRGLLSAGDLSAAADRWCQRNDPAAGEGGPGRPGTLRVCQLITRANGLSESVGESHLRLLLEDLGYHPRPQMIIRTSGGFWARVDLLVERRVVVEFDGLVKYEGADGKAALAREKLREDRLTRLGFVVVRVVWADLEHPERLRRLLEQAMVRARRAG